MNYDKVLCGKLRSGGYLMKMIYNFKNIIPVLMLVLIINGCSSNNNDSTGQPTLTPNNMTNEEKTPPLTKDEYSIAVNLYDQGKLDEAQVLFEKLLKVDQQNGLYNFYLGNIQQKENELDKAIQNYTEAINKTPKLIEAYNNLTGVYMFIQNFDKALEIANKGLGQSSTEAELLFKKAQIVYLKGQFNDSIKLLNQLTNNPAYFEAYRFLGLNYIQLNDKANALKNFKAYLQIAPEGVQAKDKVKQIVAELEKQ